MPHVFGSGLPKNDSRGLENTSSSCFDSSNELELNRTRHNRKRTESVHERMSAFDRIVALCSVRDRSLKELRDRLSQDGYEQAERDEALNRARSCGLIDDIRFAQAFIAGRIRAGKGEKIVRRDLAKHGIDADSLVGWPQDFGLGYEDQVSRALAHLVAHPPTAKDSYQAAYRKLESRGYSKNVIVQALHQWQQG